MRRLVGVETRELDRGEDLAGLHRGAAHRLELIDQRVDRRHKAVTATAPLDLLTAAAVNAVARPANRSPRGDPPEAQGAGPAPARRTAMLTIGH
jgi:hypothetical protein